jgi:hypothetical protein
VYHGTSKSVCDREPPKINRLLVHRRLPNRPVDQQQQPSLWGRVQSDSVAWLANAPAQNRFVAGSFPQPKPLKILMCGISKQDAVDHRLSVLTRCTGSRHDRGSNLHRTPTVQCRVELTLTQTKPGKTTNACECREAYRKQQAMSTRFRRL